MCGSHQRDLSLLLDVSLPRERDCSSHRAIEFLVPVLQMRELLFARVNLHNHVREMRRRRTSNRAHVMPIQLDLLSFSVDALKASERRLRFRSSPTGEQCPGSETAATLEDSVADGREEECHLRIG